MQRILLAAIVIAFIGSFGLSAAASAGEENDRLLIVNGNTGRVIYDDGRDDLFCVTWRFVVGYDIDGHRITRRAMRCR
jgi:hypothetical protein